MKMGAASRGQIESALIDHAPIEHQPQTNGSRPPLKPSAGR